ncbi:MAG: sensor domain-containing diguanylate cyclase [Mobilitalea sp.]
MEENNQIHLDQILENIPGSVAKIALDDVLTILYTTNSFNTVLSNNETQGAPLALLKIIYSADIIYLTRQLAVQKSRKDNMINVNFRILQNNGSFKWVMVSGHRTDETYQSGSKAVPVYNCIAMDVTDHMVKYKKLEQTVEYQRTITELSKELYFEYEIAKDTLTFTELFREIFDKEAELSGFRKRLESTKIIHPDELPAIINIFKSMMSGRKQVRFELRMIPKDGIPVWYICYASIIFDENKNPYKVIGKLAAINSSKKDETDDLKPIIVLDTLTGVCNRASAEAMISIAAAKQDASSLSALALIEVRNYRSLNETRKAIDGENILISIGKQMKDYCRTSDVIGRMGLGEFVVYLKDISTDVNAYDMAERFCRSIEELYSYEHTKTGISVSIGVTLHKGPKEYQNLIANANTALGMAKKSATSSFEVYNGI